MRHLILSILSIVLLSPSSFVLAKPACIAPNDAMAHAGKDVCVNAHIYRIVDASGGIQFLDACSPHIADADCHFFILSMQHGRKALGDLQGLVGKSVQIRGTIHTIQGHAAIVLRSRRQLQGRKEPFHPNPRLTKSFSAENGGRAFSAKNGSGGQRGVHFSNRGR